MLSAAQPICGACRDSPAVTVASTANGCCALSSAEIAGKVEASSARVGGWVASRAVCVAALLRSSKGIRICHCCERRRAPLAAESCSRGRTSLCLHVAKPSMLRFSPIHSSVQPDKAHQAQVEMMGVCNKLCRQQMRPMPFYCFVHVMKCNPFLHHFQQWNDGAGRGKVSGPATCAQLAHLSFSQSEPIGDRPPQKWRQC